MAEISKMQSQTHLRDYLRVLSKRRWIVITFFVILVSTVTIGSYRIKPVYQATTQILIEKESSNIIMFKEVVNLDVTQRDYYQTQYIILKSRSLAEKVIKKLGLTEIQEFSSPSPDIVTNLLKHIEIEPVRNSRVVKVSAKSFSPELSAKIANTLAACYIQQNLENRLFSGRGIMDRLSIEEEKLSKGDVDIHSLPSVVNNDLIRKLKMQLAELEAKYAEKAKHYKEKHPTIMGLRSSIRTLQKRIDLETERIVQSIKTELSGKLKGNNIRIIDYAEVPEKPIKPRKKLNILLAIIVGLTGGGGLAFFAEYLDNTVKTQEDIEKYVGLPFLGYVPTISEKNDLQKDIFVKSQPKSVVSEAFRSVRSSILFSQPEDSLKSILITSAGPREGKSIISINLAITFAQLNCKVLLVDTDLRRPIVEKALKLKNSAGLSDYLIGKIGLDKLVQKTEIENLSAIACGTIPPNPAELLNSGKLKELIGQLRKKYDKLIFDSPPVITVTDAVILAGLVDGVIQVIHSGKIGYPIINRGKEKIAGSGAKIIGAILNNLNIRKEGYYYPYYYYYEGKKKETSKKVS